VQSFVTDLATPEEIAILDAILGDIFIIGTFRVQAVYENFILAKQHVDKSGNPNTAIINRISDHLKQLGAYTHITDYLTENGLAKPTKDGLLILSVKGEHFSVYNDHNEYNSALNYNASIDEIKARVPALVAQISSFGEFVLTPPPRARLYVPSYYAKGVLDDGMIAKIVGHKQKVRQEHRTLIFDKCVLQHLVDEGFATYRHDIHDDENELYCQLTERGRKLKECGTIEAYDLLLVQEIAASVRRQKRDNRLYWINFWIAVGAIAAASYLFT
jgi:hypothetical protein